MSRVGMSLAAMLGVLLLAAGAAVGARVGSASIVGGTTTVTTGGTTIVLTDTNPTTTGGTVPDPPTLVSATPGTSGIVLIWDTPGNGGSPILNYRIYRSTTSGGETVVADTGATSTRIRTSLGARRTTTRSAPRTSTVRALSRTSASRRPRRQESAVSSIRFRRSKRARPRGLSRSAM